MEISIHAPAWGATRSPRFFPPTQVYFNSRPRVGGDADEGSGRRKRAYFNSRPRVGGDGVDQELLMLTAHISIHAPAWGATCAWRRFLAMSLRFQFTPPRGGRRRFQTPLHSTKNFNSRPRVGGDAAAFGGWGAGMTFQFTPPRGGATMHAIDDVILGAFQFTPPRGGGDIVGGKGAGDFYQFQFTPPRGGDCKSI